MSFRIQAKNFSITCPQSSINAEELMEHWKTFQPEYVLQAKELHEDGGIHYHVLLMLPRAKNLKDPKFFDYGGEHFNIQSTKNLSAWKQYIEKDGDLLKYGTEPKCLQVKKKVELMPLSQVPLNELFDYCVANRIGYGYYNEIRKKRSRVDLTIEEDPNVGTMNMFLMALQVPTDMVIVLLGQTGCGKTTWAKKHALKPSLLVSHIESLKQYDPTRHKSIIFDDMSFKHWPRENQIHIADSYDPREIHGRYTNVILPANLQKIFTCNEYPFEEDAAIARRIKLINC